jgi:hypothetical protein
MNWNDLHNTHEGETCTVIGNGPSLNDIPLRFLKKYPSFGANRIYLLPKFKATFYTAIDGLMISQWLNDIAKLPQKIKFIRASYAIDVPGSIPIVSTKPRVFCYDPNEGLYEGWTVTFVNLQIAYWMGFKRVLLVGVDHNFIFTPTPEKRSYIPGDDPNHFDPNYFKQAQWDQPNLENSRQAYILAQEAYVGHGREIINLSTRTELDVFPREDWHDYA